MHALHHVPVLRDEVIAALALTPGDAVIDATLGLGGHAALMLERIGPAGPSTSLRTGRLLGIERSEPGLVEARQRLADYASQTDLVHGDFRQIESIARSNGYQDVDAILFDLGLASWQIDTGYQGVSFQTSGPLDLRLGPIGPEHRTSRDEDPANWIHLRQGYSGQAGDAALARTVRTWRFRSASEFTAGAMAEEIDNVLRHLGGVRQSRVVADRIVATRRQAPIETTDQLVAAVGSTSPRLLAPVFQALRILVNDEFGALVAGLRAAWRLLVPGGRLAVISFHSGEDRIVKDELRALAPGQRIGKVRPSGREIAANPRARSATLRTITKVSSA